MPVFRRSVPMSELREQMTDEQKKQHETTYQASRGGWFKPADKPVPGTPKEQ